MNMIISYFFKNPYAVKTLPYLYSIIRMYDAAVLPHNLSENEIAQLSMLCSVTVHRAALAPKKFFKTAMGIMDDMNQQLKKTAINSAEREQLCIARDVCKWVLNGRKSLPVSLPNITTGATR